MGCQSGAAVGALAFPVIGPVGVVAVRQWVAGLIMPAVGRPRLRAFTWWQWRPIMALAAVFATMNISLYTAIDRIGPGLAVTLEFLGPLTGALVGAFTGVSTRAGRRVTVICALLAGAGVVVLTRPRGATDLLGIGLGLLAAVCWAGYILLNRTVGRRVPGVVGSGAAGTLSALAYSFGIFMSVSPVVAAGIGTGVLGETLAPIGWLAVGLIVTANADPAYGLGRMASFGRRIRPRATSSVVTTAATASAARSPISTRTCAAPACTGLPLPISTPTKAPGSVTSPTVRV